MDQKADGSWTDSVLPYLKSYYNFSKMRVFNRKNFKLKLNDTIIQSYKDEDEEENKDYVKIRRDPSYDDKPDIEINPSFQEIIPRNIVKAPLKINKEEKNISISDNEDLQDFLWITVWVLVLFESLSEGEKELYKMLYEKSHRLILFWIGQENLEKTISKIRKRIDTNRNDKKEELVN